jgi:uncharacterized protein (TIGR00290 family)
MEILKAFVSWSGGKDSALACFRAIKKGIKVLYLVNMLGETGKYSRSHGLTAELLKAQASAIGIPIIQKGTNWGNYEEEFKKTISELKKQGITAGVFGDIDVQEHRDWVERVCGEVGIKPILPLWKEEREPLMKELINSGFKAILCSTNASFLGSEWLGREIGFDFLRDLKALGNIDLCGENGEYHTFVYDGPIFKNPVKFSVGKWIQRDKKYFLEVWNVKP